MSIAVSFCACHSHNNADTNDIIINLTYNTILGEGSSNDYSSSNNSRSNNSFSQESSEDENKHGVYLLLNIVFTSTGYSLSNLVYILNPDMTNLATYGKVKLKVLTFYAFRYIVCTGYFIKANLSSYI